MKNTLNLVLLLSVFVAVTLPYLNTAVAGEALPGDCLAEESTGHDDPSLSEGSFYLGYRWVEADDLGAQDRF